MKEYGIDDIQGGRSLVTATIARHIPFSVNKKPLDRKIVIERPDGTLIGTRYRSYDPITDYDSKVLHIISKICMDGGLGDTEESDLFKTMIQVHEKHDETPFVAITIFLHKFARYIDPQGRNRRVVRKRIYNSLLRLAGVTIFIHNNMDADEPFTRPTGAMGWINGVSLREDYNDYDAVDLYISYDLVRALVDNSIVYSLDTAMKYSGRAYYLYMMMQSFKHKHAARNGKTVYKYWDYIPHDHIVEALQLHELKKMFHVKQEIKKAFKEIGLDYKFYITKDGTKTWKKQASK